MNDVRRVERATALMERVTGAFLGLAAGDAVGRTLAGLSLDDAAAARERTAADKRPLIHGALTTWALCALDALLYRQSEEPLDEDLGLRLRVVASPQRGAALRGPPRSLGGTLRQVATSLEKGDDARLCGIDDVTAEGLIAALPFAFALGDRDEDVARALLGVIGLTHRHARVATSAGLWIGGVRALLRQQAASSGEVLAAGDAFARLTLAAYREERAGLLVGAGSEAEGALALALAAAHGATDPRELLAPSGYDGRDAPERIAAAALLGAGLPASDLVEVGRERLAQGGDVDVTLPLLLATFGATHGAEHLPLVFVQRLATRAFVVARAEALFGERPPRLPPLIIEELRLSRAHAADLQPRDDAGASAAAYERLVKEQLKLL